MARMSRSNAAATASSAADFSASARLRSAARARSVSRNVRALLRNTATARAMAPISSPRRLPLTGTARSPAAISVIACAMRRNGRVMKNCASTKAPSSAATVPPLTTATVVR